MFRLPILFFALSLSSFAEPTLVISESTLADRIHSQNPDLKAARWKIQEAHGQWQQSGRKSRPALDVQWSHDSRMREGEVKIGISRSFPITDRLKWEKEIGKSQLAAAEMEIRSVEQQLITDAKLLLIQLIAIKNRSKWIEMDQQDAKNFAAQLEKNQQRAEASQLDAAQAQINAATLEIEQKQLNAKAASYAADLKMLLGMPITANITVHHELPSLTPFPIGQATQRADYQQALWQIESAEQKVKREYANRYDNLEAGVFLNGMKQQDAPVGYNKDLMLGFQLRIPLPFGDDNSGNIATAQAMVKRRNEEAQAILIKAQHQAQGATNEMLEWQKLDTHITSTLLPLAEKQLQLALQSYAQGQTDVSTIFQARMQKRQLLLSQVDARTAYHLARIRQQSALGQP